MHVKPNLARVLLAVAATSGASCRQAATSVPVPATSVVMEAQQLVVVTTPAWDSTSGRLWRFTRAGGTWRLEADPIPIVVGRTGLAWDAAFASRVGASPSAPVKHEGDGRSPAGVFPLDTAFGFASSFPELHLPYVQLSPTSDCVDDTTSVHYNTVVDRATVPRVDWSSAEHMRKIDQYRIGVIVGYNAAPPRKGGGSCIFLHIWAGPTSVTAGCTAMDADQLRDLMLWLDRTKRPIIVQMPATEYERLRSSMGLPPLTSA